MSMTQQETFDWLLSEKRRLESRIVELELELARYRVKPIVDHERQCEHISAEVMDFRMKDEA